MKEHAQEYGVRRWAGDDLIELQSEPLEAIQKLVEPYAPCIIQGCEVNAAEKRIAPGMVALWELDEDNRKKGVKIARFEGCVTQSFPVYLTLKRTPEERVYVDGKNKPIAYDYTAQNTTVENEVKDKFPLKITEDGGPRLPESLTVNFTAATIRENIQPTETLGTAFGKIRKWFSDLKSHAFRAIVKEDLADSLQKELDGKVDKEENKGLSTADFTHEEKAKLQGIADKANNYTLPTASSSALGGIKTNYAANGKNYKVSVDGNGNAYVNVPWTDNDTTYGAATQSVAGLMSIADKKKLDGIAEGANKTTVDSALSGTSTNPVQNMAVKTELDKKVPVLDSETAFRMLLSLGNKVCLSSSASDKITTNMYGRGGTRTTSEQAIGFLLVLKDKWEYICLIGRTTSSVTMGNFNTSYTNNNIYITKEGLYVNVINKSGALQNDALRFYKDGGTTSTLFYTKAYVNIPTGNELSMLNNILLVSILVAAATGWSPNATASADGFMSAADKTKLDGIATGANNYTHPIYTARTGYPTANQTPGFGSTFSVSQVTSDASGHVSGLTTRTVKIPATLATTSANGLMSAADKKQLTDFQIVGIYFIAQGNIEYGFKSVTLKTRQSTHGGEKCIYIMMPSETGTYMILPFAPQSQHYITTYNNRWDAGIEAIVFHRDPSGKAGYFGFGVPFLLIKTTLTLTA